MSVTNAISGMTTAGGMIICGGGILPATTPQALGLAAVVLSSVNIGLCVCVCVSVCVSVSVCLCVCQCVCVSV